MPINPNIALGIQPVQQPNILGQYAQVMGIKAAQQEMEGNESTRNYFSRPVSERGDPSQLLGTKQGQAAYKALNEGQIKQLEATQKRVGLIGAGAGAVLQNPTVENFRNVVENLVKNQVYSREDADKAIATIGNDPSKIPSFVTPLYRQAISAEKDLADKTSRANAATAAGPGHRQATLAEQKYENQLKAGGDIITSLVKDPETGQDVEMQFRRNLRTGDFEPVVLQPSSTRVDISPSSASSSFAPSGAGGGAPNVNALTTQGGAAAAPNVNALTQAPQAAPTFGRPKVPFTAPVPVIDKSGRTIYMQGKEAVQTGATPATKATEDRAIAIRKLPDAIAQSKDALNLIDRMVGTADGKTKPHKGFEGAVGAALIPGLRFVPGTSEADFQAMFEQIGGGAFLQAYNTLKGGGQITNVEGEKGTAAINRMKLATSETEFKSAARDFQTVLRRGVETAEKELRSGPGGGAAASPASTGDIATDPAIQSLLNKYK
jgi:hypothetical protein